MLTCIFTSLMLQAENAAPSMHLVHTFPSSDAILKMQKVKIVQSAYASYFEINSFTDGYCGLQQTSDPSFGKSNILIASLWDPNTAGGVFSKVEYKAASTFSSRFGGEGDGYKTINPYGWKLNVWYNIVNRAWMTKGRLYIATFINDISSGKWFHTSTLSTSNTSKYLSSYNDAFMENWNGSDPGSDGRFVRKAFFKDVWNLNVNASWEKNKETRFSANNSTADANRNGIYHNSFNAFFDAEENAYCMEHGGNIVPSAAFNGSRSVVLPLQVNQGTKPVLTLPVITLLTATYVDSKINLTWEIDEVKSPQFSTRIEIRNSQGNIVSISSDTIPNKRNHAFNTVLAPGDYTAKLYVRDIFNQLSSPVSTTITVPNPSKLQSTSSDMLINVYPNPANDFLFFSKNMAGSNIFIHSISGKKKLANLIDSNKIYVGDLEVGMYIVQILTTNGSMSQSFVRK